MTIGFHEIKLEETAVGKIVTLKFIGKLSKEDYELFVPQLEELMGQSDKVSLLVELRDFQGWTVGALWEESKFAAKHFSDIKRLAIVGDRKWEKGIAVFTRAFTNARVRYFDISEMDGAKEWIRGAKV